MTSPFRGSSPKSFPPQSTPRKSTSSPCSSSSRPGSESTPSKRKVSSSRGPETPDKAALSTTLLPGYNPGRSPSQNQSKISDGLRPPLSRKAKSTPERSVETEARSSDDEAIPIRGSKRIHSSPCGAKKYVQRGAWLSRHQSDCEKCKKILGENPAEGGHEQGSYSKHQSFVEHVDDEQAESLEEHMERTRGTGQYHEAGGKYEPDPELCERSREQDKTTNAAIAAGDSPNVKLSIPEDEMPSTEAEVDDSESVRATTCDETPLDLEDDIYPEGEPTAVPTGLQMDGSQLHDKLREKLEQRLTPSDERGYIYIFSDPKRPHLHKIGRAKKTVRRQGQLQCLCGFRPGLIERYEVDYYIRTEGLIHAYLSDLCRPYTCEKCGTRHGEWFEITKESALIFVDKWTTFMNEEKPYATDSKELHPFLRNLVKLRERLIKGSNPEKFRKDWDQILLPTAIDRFGYMFGIIWEMVWISFWPVNTMIAWTITFITIQHPATFALMAASVIGAFVTMAQDIHRLRHDTMGSKRVSARQVN